MPLPRDRRFSGKSSGNNPYFEGPKIALCKPIRKIAAMPIGRFRSKKPVVVYGASQDEAIAKVKALALRILAERLEHGEPRLNPADL